MATILATTRTEGYDNSQPYFYLHVDTSPGSGSKTLDPSAANRIQLSSNSTVQGQMQANSTLKMWDGANRSVNLAEWDVSLIGALSGYPLALGVNSLTYSAGNITAGGDYYFTLDTPGEPPPPEPTAGDIILVGDSLTAQGGTYLDDVWPTKTVVNMGVSGATTTSTLAKIDGGDYTTYDPETFVVLIGTNNVPNENATVTAAGIEDVVNGLRELKPDANVLLLSIAPRYDFDFAGTDCNDKIDEINATIEELDNGTTIRFLSISDPVFAGEATGYVGFQSDHIHWSSTGYAAVHDVVDAFVNGEPPPPSENITLTLTVGSGSPVTFTVPLGENYTIPLTVRVEA